MLAPFGVVLYIFFWWQVLGAMATAYESEDINAVLSTRMRTLVQQWRNTDAAMLESCAHNLTSVSREKVVRMATA